MRRHWIWSVSCLGVLLACGSSADGSDEPDAVVLSPGGALTNDGVTFDVEPAEPVPNGTRAVVLVSVREPADRVSLTHGTQFQTVSVTRGGRLRVTIKKLPKDPTYVGVLFDMNGSGKVDEGDMGGIHPKGGIWRAREGGEALTPGAGAKKLVAERIVCLAPEGGACKVDDDCRGVMCPLGTGNLIARSVVGACQSGRCGAVTCPAGSTSRGAASCTGE